MEGLVRRGDISLADRGMATEAGMAAYACGVDIIVGSYAKSFMVPSCIGGGAE